MLSGVPVDVSTYKGAQGFFMTKQLFPFKSFISCLTPAAFYGA
jgi:hypothetical protein